MAADGSACFEAPADRFLYFQLLDKNKMMIQSMRSGTMVRSDEVAGCVGCHDGRRPPCRLEGWLGPERLFSSLAEVQPVFDRHCLKCHDYGGEGSGKLLLAPDKALVFNASYTELWRRKLTGEEMERLTTWIDLNASISQLHQRLSRQSGRLTLQQPPAPTCPALSPAPPTNGDWTNTFTFGTLK